MRIIRARELAGPVLPAVAPPAAAHHWQLIQHGQANAAATGPACPGTEGDRNHEPAADPMDPGTLGRPPPVRFDWPLHVGELLCRICVP